MTFHADSVPFLKAASVLIELFCLKLLPLLFSVSWTVMCSNLPFSKLKNSARSQILLKRK